MSMPPVEIPARDSLSRWRQRLMLALLTAGGLSLAACTVYTASPRVLTTADGQILEVTEDQQGYVTQAPPAPLQETITVRPSVNVIWQPGIWLWGGSSYYWRPGAWVRPPLGYYGWSPGYWRHTPRGYLWQNGYWHQRRAAYPQRHRLERDPRWQRPDRPGIRPDRPAVRPERPDGQVRPGPRPGRDGVTRPAEGMNRPGVRPDRRPGMRPEGMAPGSRPGMRPDGVRPDRSGAGRPAGMRPERGPGARAPGAGRGDWSRANRPEGGQRMMRPSGGIGGERMGPRGMGRSPH